MAKVIMCYLHGGPRAGDYVEYQQPLPKTLVVSSDKGYQEYHRKPGTTAYVYADTYRNR